MEIFDEIWNIRSVGEFSNEHCYRDNSEACSAIVLYLQFKL